jgi:hypothetical protein
MIYVIVLCILIVWYLIIIDEWNDIYKKMYGDYKYFEDRGRIIEELIVFVVFYVIVCFIIYLGNL